MRPKPLDTKDPDVETTNLDDLELELRKLPGVRAAGFTERDDMLLVQIQVAGDEPTANLSQQAARIAYRHAEKPVALEIVRWKIVHAPAAPTPLTAGSDSAAPPSDVAPAAQSEADATTGADGDDEAHQRVRLLAVLTFPDTDELEVHLTFGGRRIIGRGQASGGVTAAAQATLDGLKSFAPDLDPKLFWANEITDPHGDGTFVVACSVHLEVGPRLGISAGVSRIEAAARATLQSLNRSLESLVVPER